MASVHESKYSQGSTWLVFMKVSVHSILHLHGKCASKYSPGSTWPGCIKCIHRLHDWAMKEALAIFICLHQ